MKYLGAVIILSALQMTIQAFERELPWAAEAPETECDEGQEMKLVELKDGLKYTPEKSTKLITWKNGTNCCSWGGVACNTNGAVVALNLSGESIVDGLDESTGLMGLRYLQELDLSKNPLGTHKIPRGIEKLGALRRLSLAYTTLTGPINSSILSLTKLEILHLQGNFFNEPVPRFFANFSSMKNLIIWNCGWIGTFPQEIFRMPSLETISLRLNVALRGSLPEFDRNSSIVNLVLANTMFGGIVPPSFWNLNLAALDLLECNFSGYIPSTFFNHTNLQILELEANNLAGQVHLDWIQNLPNLFFVGLSHNSLKVKANTVGCLDNLLYLYLDSCALDRIPFFGNDSRLLEMILTKNSFHLSTPLTLPPTLTNFQLSGVNASLANLEYFINAMPAIVTLVIDSCGISSTIPLSICNATQIQELSLANNDLYGSIPECLFGRLTTLSMFVVSYNNMDGTIPDTFQDDCQMGVLNLDSNYFEGSIPRSLAKCSGLRDLELQDNKISDAFPCHLKHASELRLLNLAYNSLYGDVGCIGDWPLLQVMDLRNNRYTKLSAFYNETSIKDLKSLFFLDVKFNRLKGSFPMGLCHVTTLEQVHLSYNELGGALPDCILNLPSIGVLNFKRNNFSGFIPDKFEGICAIQSFIMHDNMFEGSIPQSLSKCRRVEILNLSNNRMNGSFPCHLQELPMLKVLNLRNNYFQGTIRCTKAVGGWESLQIIDLSNNNFNGSLPANWFATWSTMKGDAPEDDEGIGFGVSHNSTTKDTVLHPPLPIDTTEFYYDDIDINIKGEERSLQRIEGMYTIIDLSVNHFDGPIPISVGLLAKLFILNLSDNAFTDAIPSSLGSLSTVEALDLSKNQLTGNIPPQLANLPFLDQLNLSNNKLEGRIPTGTQLQTFPASSYQGNEGLYGPPLPDLCYEDGKSGKVPCGTTQPEQSYDEHIVWYLEATASGIAVGIALIFAPLVLWKWRIRYSLIVDSIVEKFLLRFS